MNFFIITLILISIAFLNLSCNEKSENNINNTIKKKRLVTHDHPFDKKTGAFLTDQYTVLLLHFDKLDEEVIVDYSGKDNFGYSTSTKLVPGIINNALKFDGMSSFVEIDSKESIAKFDAQTIEFWLYIHPNQTEQYPTILSKDTTTDGSGRSSYEIYLNNNLSDDHGYDFMYRVYTDAGMSLLNAKLEWQKLADAKWHYIAAVYDGLNLKLYIDGEKINKTVSVKGNMLENKKELRLSRKYLTNKNFFNGFIDELRISNIARSDQAISNYWNFMQRPR